MKTIRRRVDALRHAMNSLATEVQVAKAVIAQLRGEVASLRRERDVVILRAQRAEAKIAHLEIQ